MMCAGLAMASRHARQAALCLAMGIMAGACKQGAGAASPATPGAGAQEAAAIEVPVRAPTAGDALLARVPMGAGGVLELDLARLRDNAAVGPAVGTVLEAPPAGELDVALLRGADALLLCSYAMGHDEAATLTLVHGAGVAALGQGEALDRDTVALGPPALVARLRRVEGGHEPSLADDRALMAVRAQAMPAQARGASVRVAARLDFDARVALAAQLELEQVPTAISAWGDVADDLALIAILTGADVEQAAAQSRLLARWRDRIAALAWVRASGLAPAIRGMDIATHGTATRAVFLIGPRRLARLVERLTSGAYKP